MQQRGDRPTPGHRWKTFLLYGNVLVAGIAVCFLLGTYALLSLPPSVPLLVLAACGAFLVYQAERLLYPPPEDAINHPARQAWASHHRGYAWGSTVLAGCGGLAMLPWLRPETLLAGSGLGLLAFAYAAPVLPRRRRLKGMGLLKPLAIAGAWALGGVLLPVLEAGVSPGWDVVALTSYRMLFVLPNALLADWPDRVGDARVGLRTVATGLTAGQLRLLAGSSIALGVLGGGTALLFVKTPCLLGIDLLGMIILGVLVLRPWPASRWFYGFAIDLVIAWPLTTAMGAWLGGG